jgi:Tfp pilus assembly protein PilF
MRTTFKAVTAAVLALALLGGACKSDEKKEASSTTKVTTPSERQVQLGITAQTRGDLDGALSRYQRALELDPTNKFAHYNVGTVLQTRNDVAGASDAYERALNIDPKYRPALYNLAILREPFAADSAEGLYIRILAITPNDANVLLRLGLLQRRMGKDAEAEANLQKAVSIKPELQAQIDAAS